MLFHDTPYVWVMVLPTALSVGMLGALWPRRDSPGARAYLALLALAVCWSVANGLEMLGADVRTKDLWRDVQAIPFAIMPVAWVVFALQYTGRRVWRRGRLLGLAIEPALAILLNLTNGQHGLMRRSFALDLSGPFPVLAWQPGPLLLPHTIYTLAVVLMGLYIFAIQLRHAAWPYRGQLVALMAGYALPVASLVIYTLGFRPLRHDFTPALGCVTIVLTAWAAFYYRFLDLAPVAGATVLESMSDGVVVLDGQGRVVGLNPAARRMLGVSDKETVGKPAAAAFAAVPELVALCNAPAPARAGVPITLGLRPSGGGPSSVGPNGGGLNDAGPSSGGRNCPAAYEAHTSPLAASPGHPLGSLLTLHDASERMAQEGRSVEQQRALAVLEERERLARELHDSLGQVLGFVYLQSETARGLLANGETARVDTSLGGVARAAQEAQRDVREYILSTRAPLLHGDFFPALREFLAQFGELYGLCVELSLPEGAAEPAFAPRVEVQLLRIIQEALSNVRKHARAYAVEVGFELLEHGSVTRVTIEDDGCGFEPAAVAGGQGYGLASMRSRAEEVGGRLRVASAPGEGTRVIVEVPVAGGAA